MNHITVKCIKCGRGWEKEAILPYAPGEYSGGLCKGCFRVVITPLIKRKQKKEGNFPCFGAAHSYCDQQECKYRNWCIIS